jgi:hypothetical protein
LPTHLKGPHKLHQLKPFSLHADDSLVLHSLLLPYSEHPPRVLLSVCELAKIFLTSKFSYLLCFATPPI